MFHFSKHINHIIVITGACIIFSTAPIFANAQPVVDSPANVKLQNIYDRLGSMYQNCMVPQYSILSTYCNYKLSDLNQSILAVGGQTADVSSKLITTNNYLSSIDSKQKDYTQYIDNLESEMSNINWKTSSSTYEGAYSDLGNTTIPLDQAYYGKYIYFKFTQASDTHGLLKYDIRFRSYYQNYFYDFIDNIEIVRSSGDLMYSFDKFSYYQHNNTYTSILLLNDAIPLNASYYLKITLKDNRPAVLFSTFSATLYYLNNNDNDYYTMSNYLIDMGIFDKLSVLDDFKELYASDDMIAAKEQQQNYEDQAINDFTGNGNAAASTSDTTNMKNVSGAIKSGLDSGGSVNGALGVFNTSGGLWDWFSQSNYDEINGTQTRSRSSDEYIDFYSINREKLEELLGEYR